MTAEPLVVRDDLSRRTVLSKSALTTFDLCQSQAWFDLHDRRPVIPNERMTFGSAVDAAVEQIIVFLRAGMTVEMPRVMAAVDEVIAREETGVDRDEVERAAELFMLQVAGGAKNQRGERVEFDWSFARTQPTIDITRDDLGDINGHPDIVLRNGDVWDVKTSKRAKFDEVTLELGIYDLLVETETGQPVATVGYLTYCRTAKPYWQVLEFAVTDELRRWTIERAAGYIRAKKADSMWNKKSATPVNVSFGGGPKFASLCEGCAYNPANGGPCAIAWRGELAS